MSDSHFVISVFDSQLWCSVLQCRFAVDDLDALRTIVGADTDADPDFNWSYRLNGHALGAINKRFTAGIEITHFEGEAFLFRHQPGHSPADVPYLIHTGFELPLMLDGRKKLACFTNPDPEKLERAFDRWVDEGVIHKKVFQVPTPVELLPYAIDPERRVDRDVYYTLKGEEWRIGAMRLLWQAAIAGDGWNEHHERLEGMLFGYEDWQNDWWIEDCNRANGGVGGVALCLAVDAAGLAWIESAGHRALPPIGSDVVPVRFHQDDEGSMKAFLLEQEDAVALVRFKVSGTLQRKLFPVGREPSEPFLITRNQIPSINGHLKRQVDVVLLR